MVVTQSNVRWQFALVYLDDTLTFRKTPEHINHVCKVHSLVSNAKATLKLQEWNFFSDTVDNLAHVIQPRLLELA